MKVGKSLVAGTEVRGALLDAFPVKMTGQVNDLKMFNQGLNVSDDCVVKGACAA